MSVSPQFYQSILHPWSRGRDVGCKDPSLQPWDKRLYKQERSDMDEMSKLGCLQKRPWLLWSSVAKESCTSESGRQREGGRLKRLGIQHIRNGSRRSRRCPRRWGNAWRNQEINAHRERAMMFKCWLDKFQKALKWETAYLMSRWTSQLCSKWTPPWTN